MITMFVANDKKNNCCENITWCPIVFNNILCSAEVNSFSAGTVFRRQNLTSKGVRFWRLKSIPALKLKKKMVSIYGLYKNSAAH